MDKAYKKLLATYLDAEKQGGRRSQGLLTLKSGTPKLFEYLEEAGLKLKELGVKDAQAYQGWLLEKGRRDGGKYNERTIAYYLVCAGSLYEYLRKQREVSANPFKEVRRVRTRKTVMRDLLKEKELDELLEELGRYGEAGSLKNQVTRYKTHLIAELMYSSGLRISEVAELKLGDLDFENGTVRVAAGKGGFYREAFLNDYAKEILRLYVLSTRKLVFTEWNLLNKELLFGSKWSTLGRVINRELKKVADKLGHKGFRSHQLRHALGYHLLRAGCPIRYIQSILGHKLLRNTEIYTHVDEQELKEVFEKYHPRTWRRERG